MDKQFPKIEAALTKEAATAWDVVDALADELPLKDSDFDYGELMAVAGYLKERQVETTYEVLKHRTKVARYVKHAKPSDAAELRRCSVSTVLFFAKGHWPQRQAADEIRANGVPTVQTVQALTRGNVTPSSITEPSDWTPSQWAVFDKKVIKAAELIAEAMLLRHQGDYEPSTAAATSLALLKPSEIDWDAELAGLTE